MEYEKVTHREHVLKRPDTYVGSLEYDEFIGMSPAMYKIIDEILVNAFDEYMRDSKMNEIRVSVDSSTIKVLNNKCIPVILHPKEKIWIPELVFGHLLTSSNYDDSKERFTGGRNGYGAKLTNIFSKKFTVTSCDPNNNLEYTQTWTDNMSVCNPPKMKKYSKKTGWLTVEFQPDTRILGIFNQEAIKKRVVEIGLWGPNVYFNEERLNKTFREYALELSTTEKYAHQKHGNWEIVVSKSEDGFKQQSFVNGVSTSLGGTHVDHVVSCLCKLIKDVKPYQLKTHLNLFVKVCIDKPTFSSQTKTECTSKITDHVELKQKFIKEFLSIGFEDTLASNRLKKTDGSKKSRITGIPKLDDANWAGTTKSDQCCLILTEGDSAKALAISGLTIVGRDRYGVFPLKGKPKNVRDVSVKQLETNKEFSDLKKILGLKQGEVYNNTKSLRYGRVIIMTDADLDGSHIKGLILNMFHVFWPSLITMGYVTAMVTPVIKIGKNWFFTEEEYKSSNVKGVPKYYKGLGTSTSTEAKEYFKMIDKLLVIFEEDASTDASMTLAFSKDKIPDRKEWLSDYMSQKEREHIPYGHIGSLCITDFIKKDQVKFSEEDVKRSIPHFMDGLKPSQRKVIFACLKRHLDKDMTVAQLSGYIGEHSAYHHGETSLHGTIIGLAQNFIGSNNLNLLVPSGQFGSRLEGGKDCASARYISTRLSHYTKHIFDDRDKPLLNWLKEDAKDIEPEFYCPVIPMVLINGCEGIGTGFSTFIPPYNPDDITQNLIRLIDKKPMIRMKPWYRGFTGKVTQSDKHTWIFSGRFENSRVVELPPGKWIQDYKEFLDTLVSTGKIKGYENHSTETHPDFLILGCTSEEDLKLNKTIHTSNMNLMTQNGIRKFDSPEEILVEYARVRIKYYKLRKQLLLDSITKQLKLLRMKMKFIRHVISNEIRVFMRKKNQIQEDMKAREIDEEYWELLMNIKTYQYTEEELENLANQIRKLEDEFDELRNTRVTELWKTDISLIQEEKNETYKQ